MKILVTGAAGFIGFSLCKKLLEEGHTVIGFDNLNDYYDVDLKKARLNQLITMNYSINSDFYFIKGSLECFKSLEKTFKEYQPNCVINLAAQAGVRYSLINPFSYIQSNIVGFQNIIELSKNFKVDNFLYASSSSVYGGNINMPFKESTEVDHPISLYAATKRSNELVAHTYSNLFNLSTTGMRFFTVYGPWGRPDMALFLFTKAIINNDTIEVFNNGDMLRDFTYIDDVVESIYRLISKPATNIKDFDKSSSDPSKSWCPFRIFNIGNSKPTPILDYISEIEKCLNKKAKIQFMPMQLGDVKATSADISLLEDWINFRPSISIKDGVKNFVKWYKEFYKV